MGGCLCGSVCCFAFPKSVYRSLGGGGYIFAGSDSFIRFVLPPDIPVYGGFSGSETQRDERDTVNYPTILSGDIGVTNDSSDNAYNVVIPSNGSLLDGFTVRDGNASQNYGDARGWGAGLYADGITFSVANCTFTYNRARSRGGAVFLQDANATFSNCTFSNNHGTAWAEQIAMDMQGLLI